MFWVLLGAPYGMQAQRMQGMLDLPHSTCTRSNLACCHMAESALHPPSPCSSKPNQVLDHSQSLAVW
jgi:hypothetical protein